MQQTRSSSFVVQCECFVTQKLDFKYCRSAGFCTSGPASKEEMGRSNCWRVVPSPNV